MSDITIIGARRATLLQIEAVLRDWVALEIIGPVRVVDVDALQRDDGRIPATVLTATGSSVEVLQDGITASVNELGRLCLVSFAADDDHVVTQAQAVTLMGALISSMPQASKVQAHVYAGSAQDNWRRTVTPLLGWHNVVISPEDSPSPGQGSSPLSPSHDDPRWITHVVGSLCALLGLWQGQAGGVLDNRQAPAGEQFVPVRVYSRSLSAQAVERALYARLLDVGQAYPAPRVDSTSAVVAPDEAAVAVGMADTLLAKHSDVLPHARVCAPPVAKHNLDFMMALREFFGFLINTLRNLPRRTAEELIARTKQGVARGVENVVFGGAQDAGFAVVVKGVRADGSPASWADFERGIDAVVQRSSPGVELSSPPQTPELWTDFADAGMTLLDAGRRSGDLPPVMQGAQRAIVATTSRVAPAQEDTFELPHMMAAFLPGWTLEVADDIGAGRLSQKLDELKQTNPSLAHETNAEQQRLRSWRARATQSYVGRLGVRLGGAHRQLVDEIAALDAGIAALSQQAPEDDIANDQEALARQMKYLTLGSFVGLGLFGALTGLSRVAMWLGVLLMVVTVVSWVVGCTMLYLKKQGRLYAYLHRIAQSATDLETAKRHRLEALEDLRRISRVYRQYLDWARAFGAFVHAPLGRAVDAARVGLHVGQGLPRSISIGTAMPAPDAIDEVSNGWRSTLFEAGWLADCWTEFLTDVPPGLGDLKYAISADAGELLADRNLDGQGPTLTRWSHAAAQEAAFRGPSHRFVTKVKGLTLTDDAARAHLLSVVEVPDRHSGAVTTQTRSQFLAGLDHNYPHTPMQFLDGAFSPQAQSITVRNVQESILQEQFDGLTLATVLVQLGDAHPVTDLRGTPRDERDDGPVEPQHVPFV
ncbi:hypothetical protein BA895_19930 [Humibacillus sp. DSM 29435]|uniref:hypothetical protein n=1 Tax=Humibacillus sp. DSM 29435 TaxID=1869167 RepID=UPI000871F0C9|nr:hypothetical protein [Humibacillus sp. DSM 29435]OFE16161.1 hypothetical protein BA895_19930 [Humibacillus sp. DSM 29435]